MKCPRSIPDTRHFYLSQAVRKWIFSVGSRCSKAQNLSEGSIFTLLMSLAPAGCSLCLLLPGTVLGAFAATTTHLLLSWHQKSPALCWLANCQRAMAAKGFTLQPQRISGHIQTAKGQPGAVPYKQIFWFWTLPSALKPSPGILFLFDSLKKTPMGGRENNTSQQSHVKTMRLFLSIHNKCKPGNRKFLIKVYYVPSNSFTKSARNMY